MQPRPDLDEHRLRYFRVAAQRAGVPEMHLDDAMQDIAIRVWRSGKDEMIVIRRGAIDAARRYGGDARRGLKRNEEYLSKEVLIDGEATDLGAIFLDPHDAYSVVDRLLDLKRVWHKLSPLQRKCLTSRQGVDAERWYSSRRNGRVKLRKLLA